MGSDVSSSPEGRFGSIQPITAADVFDAAIEAYHRLFSLPLSSETWDGFRHGADETYDQLLEVELIWDRICADRVEELEALRARDAISHRIGVLNYTLGDGSQPELDAAWERERRAETAVWLDFKSLFVFGDVLLSRYVLLSKSVWQAPERITHERGVTPFLISVRKAEAQGRLSQPFAGFMAYLREPLQSLDNVLGIYRDLFVIHQPSALARTGGIASISSPLDFSRTHGRPGEPDTTDVDRLRQALGQLKAASGDSRTEDDPRRRLWDITSRLDRLDAADAFRVRELVKEWGMRSPPVDRVAGRLADVLTLWATLLWERLREELG